MKLKLEKVKLADGTEREISVMAEGKPVYVHGDGTEVPGDLPAAVLKIKTISEERDGLRDKLKAAEDAAKPFDGLDAEKARKAIETVAALDGKKLTTVEEQDRWKADTRTAYEKKEADAKAAFDKRIGEMEAQIFEAVVGSKFYTSKFVNERMTYRPKFIRNEFGDPKSWKVEGSTVIGLDRDGKPIMSQARPGEYADFDEVLERRAKDHPDAKDLLKAPATSGSGTPPVQGDQPSPTDTANLTAEQEMTLAFAQGARSAAA